MSLSKKTKISIYIYIYEYFDEKQNRLYQPWQPSTTARGLERCGRTSFSISFWYIITHGTGTISTRRGPVSWSYLFTNNAALEDSLMLERACLCEEYAESGLSSYRGYTIAAKQLRAWYLLVIAFYRLPSRLRPHSSS